MKERFFRRKKNGQVLGKGNIRMKACNELGRR